MATTSKKDVGIMSRALGIYPVRINSSLVTAQLRDRYYWTNIKTRKDEYDKLDSMDPKDIWKKELDELEDVIAKAVKKVRGTKENDLCKYIPMNSGGYMHHFTLRKMKYKSPKELNSLIEKSSVNISTL